MSFPAALEPNENDCRDFGLDAKPAGLYPSDGNRCAVDPNPRSSMPH